MKKTIILDIDGCIFKHNGNLSTQILQTPELLPGVIEKLNESESILARIGNVNMRALEVYDNVKGEYEKIREKVEQLEREKLEIFNIIAQIDRKKKKTFLHTLDKINELFSLINSSFN